MTEEVTESQTPEIERVLEIVTSEVREHWDASRDPLLVSLVAPSLSSRGINYKELIGTVRLGEFLTANSEGRFQVVRHPTKQAKVGLIPAGEQFTYPPEPPVKSEEAPRPGTAASKRRSTRYALLNFLDALRELPPEELDKIILPVSALVKLLDRK